YKEAVELWELLQDSNDKDTHRELAIFYEHRDKNFLKALNYAEKGLEKDLSDYKRKDLLKRIERLKIKIKKLEEET
ncbi:MAG: hypothetical protein P8Y04_08475, partial [Desulfobulbaceae bacterium]